MDYARKLGKPKPSPLKNRSVISSNLKCQTFPEPLIEDNKLSNWKKWLNNRKKHQEIYTKILQRNENELLLNSGEKFRSVMEIRELMEFASDPLIEAYLTKNIDSTFLTTPEILPNHGNPHLPDIEVPSKMKFNSIDKFVHVASPDLILQERNLSKPGKLKNLYLDEKLKKLADILSIIDPNPPKMEKLFVQGKHFKGKNIVKKMPIITITTAEETERETSEWSINHDAMIAALRIENEEIVRILNPKFGYKLENRSFNWDIKFSCNIDEFLEKQIFFENKGNVKISFNWRPICHDSSNFPLRKREISSFFFNKNHGIILPGQNLKFSVWFKARKLGVKTENWRFVTDPVLTFEDITFRFWGCCSDERDVKSVSKTKLEVNILL